MRGTITRVDSRSVDLSASHWSVYHQHWERLEPPLRVNPEIVSGYTAVIGASTERVLLQGVTPELGDVGASLVAIDRSPATMGAIWPGDTDRRRSVLGNWFDLPFRAQSFGAVMGDAGLSILEFRQARPESSKSSRACCDPGRPWPRACFASRSVVKA
jgi:hypothetical protein